MKGTWQQCYKSGSGGQQWSSRCTGIRFVLLLGFLRKVCLWSFRANLSEITQQFQDFSRFLFLDSLGGALRQSRFKVNLNYLSKCSSPSPTKPHFSLLAALHKQKVWTANGCGLLPDTKCFCASDCWGYLCVIVGLYLIKDLEATFAVMLHYTNKTVLHPHSPCWPMHTWAHACFRLSSTLSHPLCFTLICSWKALLHSAVRFIVL